MIGKFEKIKISVLAKDLSVANEISHELRAFNIIASVFVNLDNFLLGFEDHNFDLNIIASDCICQGSLSLKNYSAYNSGKMKVALFYNDNQPGDLLKSYGINHYGLIRAGVGLRSQLQSIMNIILKEKRLEDNTQNFKSELRLLSNKNMLLEKENIRMSQKLSSINEFSIVIENLKSGADFLSSLNSELKSWAKCTEFSLLSFNEKTSKLFSLKIENQKYKELPSMSLNKDTIFRDDFLSMIEMAFKEQFSSNIRALKLGEIILIGSFNEDLNSSTAWSFFESALDSLAKNSFNLPMSSNEHLFSKFLQKIDDDYFNLKKHGSKFLTIDMSNLIQLTSRKYNSRFYWESFIENFKDIFKNDSLIKSVVFSGVSHVYIECDSLKIKDTYDLVKTKIMDFKYWEFFEDSSITFSQKDYPSINLTPSNAVGILRSEESTLKVNLSKQMINLN